MSADRGATLHVDFETRSIVDLIRCGVYVYAAHPSTRLLCMAYRFGHDDVRLWIPGQPLPRDVVEHVRAGYDVAAHNAGFELNLWNMMHTREPDVWPRLDPAQVDCTMARALALGLPGGLDKLGTVFDLAVKKDKRGKFLIDQLCKPQTRRGDDKIYWNDDPALLAEMYEYCKTDVLVECELDDLLPPLHPTERKLWALDFRINSRGIGLDAPAVNAARNMVLAENRQLNDGIKKLTKIDSAQKRAALLEWLTENGLALPDLKKRTVELALERQDLTPDLRAVLKLRQDAAKASTAKLMAMLRGASADGRARGLYKFHGASTGRWSGQRIQLQNLPRTSKAFGHADAETVIGWLHNAHDPREIIDCMYGSVLNCVSYSLRAMLRAAPGQRYLCADYSNIEGRVIAWLAGEDWKLDAFRQYDAKTGHDLYILAYHRAFGVPIDQITDDERQLGKVMELALGFGGGHGAFVSMAQIYGCDLNDIVETIKANASPDEWDKAKWLHSQKGVQHHGLAVEQWCAIRIIIKRWRESNSAIPVLWRELEEAAADAVQNPGIAMTAARGLVTLIYNNNNDFLWLRLPSGRSLAYHKPSWKMAKTPWGEEKRQVSVHGTEKGAYWKFSLWGGFISQNITQAIARDVMGAAMLRLEHSGYPIVLHTHDETAAELPYGRGTLSEFENIMAELPPWADGLPVTVAGWEGERYRKG